jgi:hypothetical protein
MGTLIMHGCRRHQHPPHGGRGLPHRRTAAAISHLYTPAEHHPMKGRGGEMKLPERERREKENEIEEDDGSHTPTKIIKYLLCYSIFIVPISYTVYYR